MICCHLPASRWPSTHTELLCYRFGGSSIAKKQTTQSKFFLGNTNGIKDLQQFTRRQNFWAAGTRGDASGRRLTEGESTVTQCLTAGKTGLICNSFPWDVKGRSPFTPWLTWALLQRPPKSWGCLGAFTPNLRTVADLTGAADRFDWCRNKYLPD